MTYSEWFKTENDLSLYTGDSSKPQIVIDSSGKSIATWIFDDGSNNVFAYNYWSDWTSPDVDADGIVDTPYSIDGNSNNHDQYPLVVSPSVHYLTPPVLVFPVGGEVLSGEVTVLWTSSVETWGYDITYSLYYSLDGGTSLVLLAADNPFTSLIWDTTGVSDGLNYLLKVEAVSTGGVATSFITPNSFAIDNTPPKLSIDSPLLLTYTTGTITVTLSGDAEHYWYYTELVDSQNQTWTTSVDRTFPDGTYTLHAYGNDSVGNIAHVSVIFTISTPSPTSPTSTTTPTSMTTTSTTDVTPSWNTILLLLSLLLILSWRKWKKKY